MENKNALQLGIAAFKAGEKGKARFYLLKAVREEPNNESAWGWLSNTAITAEERIRYLQQVVTINPQNTSVVNLLKELENNESMSIPQTMNSTKQVIRSDALYRRNTLLSIASSISAISTVLLIVGFLIICCVIGLAVYGGGS